MIQLTLLVRTIIRDKVFVYLFVTVLATFLIATFHRTSGLEQSSLPFTLNILFFVVNTLFALITLRRDTLLSYMFLTATIVLNGTLFFFYRYLELIQKG